MYADFITIFLAFLEGFALIISPCILPILPLILTGSLTGGKSRPLGIITGFIVVFSLITLFTRMLVQLTNLPPDVLRISSFILLGMIGIIMLSSTLTEKFAYLTRGFANVGQSYKNVNHSKDFLSGFLFGSLVSLVWTPCAGPILAAVIVQVAVQETPGVSIFIIFAFALGAALPMLIIALLGRGIMARLHFFRDHGELLRKLLGLIILLSVVYLAFGPREPFAPVINPNVTSVPHNMINRLEAPYPAPALANIESWINSPPLTINALKGKVILIDFWTYSCINCIRTLPYLKNWYEKYHDKGLVIIGVHAPEFAFEKNSENVKKAVTKFGIKWPIALDNNFATWLNYKNHYWPAHYLIDKDGYVVYEHFGEGAYDVTENNIQYLLEVAGPQLVQKEPEKETDYITPEIYLGYLRGDKMVSEVEVQKNVAVTYRYPETLMTGAWALAGKWSVEAEKIVAMEAGASLKLYFKASKVYAVMGNTHGIPIDVTVKLNDGTEHQVRVEGNELYPLIDLPKTEISHLELIANGPGLEIYTFTFGQ